MSQIVGKVVFVKDEKTAKVLVERTIIHPVYKKVVRKHKNYACHTNIAVAVGDIVEIISCRPISKTKSFEISAVVKKAEKSAM